MPWCLSAPARPELPGAASAGDVGRRVKTVRRISCEHVLDDPHVLRAGDGDTEVSRAEELADERDPALNGWLGHVGHKSVQVVRDAGRVQLAHTACACTS
jgi:hypothetical protein